MRAFFCPGLTEPVCLPLTCFRALEPVQDKPLGKPPSPESLSYRVASPGGHQRPGACRAGLRGSAYFTPLGDCAFSSCRVITYTVNPYCPLERWVAGPTFSSAVWVRSVASTAKSYVCQTPQCSLVLRGPSLTAKVFPFTLLLGQGPRL